MKLRPLHDRVIVKRVENETKTASGIVIPDSAAEKPDQGEVLAVGAGTISEKGDVRPLDVKAGEQRKPEYLAINPMGKVPAIRHGETVVTEAAAICAYLADVFPQAGLAPPPTSHLRGPYYRCLFFAAGPIEQATSLMPSSVDANYGLGYAYVQQGRMPEAKVRLCKARARAGASDKREIEAVLTKAGLSCE